jgi:hypothetical protein
MAQLDWYIRANLKLRHLQLLVVLDDLRHLGRAAAALNVTPPAASLTLAELERGLEPRGAQQLWRMPDPLRAGGAQRAG